VALVFQVLSLSDLDEVYRFADHQLQAEISDPTRRTFQAWSAPWRKEALEHYLKLGWSFIAREKRADEEGPGQTAGFFLAQPFLFFRAQTQSLWVEHVAANTAETRAALLDVATRVAREKHFQRTLIGGENDAIVILGGR
jgi:hypothetical protein